MNFGFGRVGNFRHFVLVKIGLFHRAALDGDRVMHRGGEAVNRCAFDLRADAIRIDRAAAIDRVNQALNLGIPSFMLTSATAAV